MTAPSHDPIREFIRAFNEGDIDAFAATLHEDVELHSGRGMRKGVGAARQWATKSPGGVQQTIELDELWEETGRAVALITRRWRWEEDGSHAGAEEMAWRFELEDGLIAGWRPYDDRVEALRDGGFAT